ncbi:MAG: hypothetical protein OXF27_21930, partial [Acidobacteria bacterium]|nr:hypothetical protein [Acidobacteriota bacterium]
MRMEEGPRAWQVLLRIPAYQTAWLRRQPQPGLREAAPFPVRLQTPDDLAAARFGPFAWEDPFAQDGPGSPSGCGGPALPAAVGPQATPLAGEAVAADLSAAGLRLADGRLVLKLERGAGAVQFVVAPGCGFGPGDGVLAQHDLLEEPGRFVARLREA